MENKYPIYHAVEQGSDEWFELRKGKMSASHAQAIATAGKGLDTYIDRTMAEYYSNGERESFSNKHTDRGNELEPQARSMYAFENEVEVREIGFIQYSEFVGCSPDTLVGDVGGLEIKCLDDYGHYLHLKNGEKEIDSGHIWQIQMSLLITGRKWWDYMLYNPNSKIKTIIIYRILPDQEKFKKLLIGLEVGEEKIKQALKLLKN